MDGQEVMLVGTYGGLYPLYVVAVILAGCVLSLIQYGIKGLVKEWRRDRAEARERINRDRDDG